MPPDTDFALADRGSGNDSKRGRKVELVGARMYDGFGGGGLIRV